MSVLALLPRALICRLAPVIIALSPAIALAQAAGPVETQALAIWRLLDYMAVDYREAVRDGTVINEDEYAEMTEFAAQVQTRLQELPEREGQAALIAKADALATAVASKAPESEVAPAANALAEALLLVYPAPKAPRTAPDIAVAASLYEAQCASCHGLGGHGDGPLAAGMEPPPVDFHDAERQRHRSVFALHGIITNGVEGTAMGPYPHLSDEQRWALAFYVGQMLYSAEQRAAGAQVWRTSPEARTAIPGLEALVQLTPAQLEAKLGPESGTAVMAFLRRHPEAAMPSAGSVLNVARERIQAAVTAHAEGRRSQARDLALSAYLDGFEMAEPALAARDAALVRQIEAAMLGFRNLMEGPTPAETVEAEAARLLALLDQAAERMGEGDLSAAGAFASSFIILFREGLEAMLVLVAMIAVLRKSGRTEALRYVHAGWASALVLGLLTWVVATYVIHISGAGRELTEAFTGLLAVVILVFVGLWLHNQSLSGKWQQYIRERIHAELSRNRLWGLGLLAFVAVYREAFETVLFYRALWEQGAQSALLAGMFTAAAVLAVVAWALFKASVRLPIARFFSASAVLIAALAIVLAGKAVHAFQEAGTLGISPLPLPMIEWIGLYPSMETVLAQLAVLVIVLGGGFWNRRRAPLVAAEAAQK